MPDLGLIKQEKQARGQLPRVASAISLPAARLTRPRQPSGPAAAQSARAALLVPMRLCKICHQAE
jgi:hypothetical protein